MTKKIFSILACLAFPLGYAWADHGYDRETVVALDKSAELVERQWDSFSKWSAFEVYADFARPHEPRVTIFRVEENLKKQEAESEEVFSNSVRYTQDEGNEIEREMEFFKAFKFRKMRMREDLFLGRKTFRFDSLDENGVVRSSEWRDTQTGLDLKFVQYRENGEPLSVSFKTHIKYDRFRRWKQKNVHRFIKRSDGSRFPCHDQDITRLEECCSRWIMNLPKDVWEEN